MLFDHNFVENGLNHTLRVFLVETEGETDVEIKEKVFSALDEEFRFVLCESFHDSPSTGLWKNLLKKEVILGAENPEKFIEEIEFYEKFYKKEIKDVREKVLKENFFKTIETIDYEEKDKMKYFACFYWTNRLLNLLRNKIDEDTIFVDLELKQSYLTKERKKYILENIDNYAIVFVDCIR